MFNKEDSNSKNGTNVKSPSLNMISEGTRIKGDLQSDNDVRISGNVDGQANSKGRVIVTSKGHIEGNVKAKDADIAGKLDGEMFISGKLILRQTAVINGDIHTKTLLVEEGAQINGNCKMGVDSSKPLEGRVNNIKEIKKPEKQTAS